MLKRSNCMPKTFKKSQSFFKRVSRIIPLASQTFSKSYLQYIKGQAPLFQTSGKGSHIIDVDGNQYLDMINSLAAVSLGYQYPAVDEAIRKQLRKGISYSLPSPLEHELSALLVKLIPCAEMVRFGKNGSDATTGAIRLARAVTGRDHVAVCGYHGWHDWYIGTTARNLGVPDATKRLTHKFDYNDIRSLEKIFRRYPKQIAAVIMEPMSYIEPIPGFLATVKKLTHKHGALLVFDETVTGFRFDLGGAQKYFNVIPDLATFGKAMANGMPISALVGRGEYMKKVADIFYSFTFGGEALSLAAAIATIKEMQRKNVIGHIWKQGKYLQDGARRLIGENGLEQILKLKGKPCWQVVVVSPAAGYSDLEIKSFLQQELLQRGVLWYGQHNMSFSHTKADMDLLLGAYRQILPKLKEYLKTKKLKQHLRGKPITNVFKVR